MPIIEPSPANSQQLLQGDILQGVGLYATACSWRDDGGESAKAPHKLCLVLSRPCVAMHKRTVVVAGIKKYSDAVPKDAKSFKQVREFLTNVRDGVGSPDLFYLGQLPEREGRFCARLDELYCVQVPPKPETLSIFLRERRIGTLHAEFARDLHIRVFMAFASLGFSDESWLPDRDLDWLVQAGNREISEAEVELNKAMQEKASQEADGKTYRGETENLERRVASLRSQVQPYVDEKSRRE